MDDGPWVADIMIPQVGNASLLVEVNSELVLSGRREVGLDENEEGIGRWPSITLTSAAILTARICSTVR